MNQCVLGCGDWVLRVLTDFRDNVENRDRKSRGAFVRREFDENLCLCLSYPAVLPMIDRSVGERIEMSSNVKSKMENS